MPSIVEASALAASSALLGAAPLAALLLWTRRSLRAAHRSLREDDLTRLANRRAFLAELEIARQRKQRITAALLDVNQFKKVNDSYGHQAGDQVLCAVASRLRSLPQPVRLCARLSGDEFVLLIDGDAAIGAEVARRVWWMIAAHPVNVGGYHLRVTVSIGVAALAGSAYEQLLPDADRAMYEAKKGSHGVSVIRPPTSPDQKDRRRRWPWRNRLTQSAPTRPATTPVRATEPASTTA